MKQKLPHILNHYCSNLVFASIVEHKTIWLSSMRSSNDSREGLIWIELLSNMISKEIPNEADALIDFVQRFVSCFDALALCLTENADQLSQWRGYGDGGKGISVGFDPKIFEHPPNTEKGHSSLALANIVYDASDQRKRLQPLIAKLAELGSQRKANLSKASDPKVVTMLSEEHLNGVQEALIGASRTIFEMKHQSFSEEREWRAFRMWFCRAEAHEVFPCEFRTGSDRLIPFSKLEFADFDNPIKSLVLGPMNKTPLDVVESFLAQNNLHGVKVTRSESSLRV